MKLSSGNKNYLTVFFFILIIVYAFFLRQDFLYKAVACKLHNQPEYVTKFLISDALGYYKNAIENEYPCFTTERPPFFLLITRFAIKNFGYINAGTLKELKKEKEALLEKEFMVAKRKILYNHIILRYFSIFYNLMAITALFILALLVFGRTAALIASFLWTVNTFSITFSYDYFRGDLTIFLSLIVLICFIFIQKYSSKIKYIITAAVISIISGTALILTRISYFPVLVATVLIVNFIAMFFKNWNLKLLIVSSGIFIGCFFLSLPYFLYNYRAAGTAAPFMHKHAKYWRNHEFAGKPGFPTKTEIQRNLYCGENITFYDYVFKLHTFPEIIKRYTLGYFQAFYKYLPRLQHYIFKNKFIKNISTTVYFPWLCLLVPIGVILSFLNKNKKSEKAMTVLFSILVLLPFAFILPLDTTGIWVNNPANRGVDLRFTYPFLPFAFLFIGAAISEFKILLFEYFKNRKKSEV
ncbi:MAG: hypothetical protein K9M56_07285 [Victivallales bacterium]|nr:hypothetical protein [Victivallales bacterium]